MTKAQLKTLISQLGGGLYYYNLTPRLLATVSKLVESGSTVLPGVPTQAAPAVEVFESDKAGLVAFLATLTTPAGQAAHKLSLRPVVQKFVGYIILRFSYDL